jgi:hypothetical protein
MSKFAVTSGTSIQKLAEHPEQAIYPVIDKETGRYLGFIRREDIKSIDVTEVSTCGAALARTDPPGLTRSIYADPHDAPAQVLRRITDLKSDFLPVVDHQGRYTGTVDIKGLSELLETEA